MRAKERSSQWRTRQWDVNEHAFNQILIDPRESMAHRSSTPTSRRNHPRRREAAAREAKRGFTSLRRKRRRVHARSSLVWESVRIVDPRPFSDTRLTLRSSLKILRHEPTRGQLQAQPTTHDATGRMHRVHRPRSSVASVSLYRLFHLSARDPSETDRYTGPFCRRPLVNEIPWSSVGWKGIDDADNPLETRLKLRPVSALLLLNLIAIKCQTRGIIEK